jgi:predicted ATPase/DNA-binding winged helix-turn-helix (wHTH) protein
MRSSQQVPAPNVVAFGPFHLSISERRLERHGVPVKIGSRALDILMCLAEQPGLPVSNQTLINRVWQGLVVEGSSLRVNIVSLRRALADDSDDSPYIANIPGRGYCLAAPLSHVIARRSVYPLPHPLRFMVGRTELVQQLAKLLPLQRFITIVGAGGMGKTATAIVIAHSLRAEFDEAVCFVDLAEVTDPELLTSTLLATLDLTSAGDTSHVLADWLRDKKFLLILDNCEHIIDAVAILAEQLHQLAPELYILATSREALHVRGEYVHRLRPLECPPDNMALTAEQTLTYPAVKLFIERARAHGAPIELTDQDAPLVTRICRLLDGVALPIELLASRVASFGLHGTAELLYKGMLLSCQAGRNATPRHQTLAAMLDWSYHLLPECEQTVLRRLSVFVGSFSLQGALFVSTDSAQDRPATVAALDRLVAKSLVCARIAEGRATYRLLESTRAYAAEKLSLSGEARLISQRNAQQMVRYLEQHAAENATFSEFGSLPQRQDYLCNLRACYYWCFSDGGDALQGASLCAAAVQPLIHLSLLEECLSWSERAISVISGNDGYQREEMVLQEARAIASMSIGAVPNNVLVAIERGLELAQCLGDRHHEMRLLTGLNIYYTHVNNLPAARETATRSAHVASQLNDAASLALAEWMLGSSQHLMGNQDAALRHYDRGMALIDAAGSIGTFCFGCDHKIRAMAALTRTLWLKDEHSRAMEMARQTVMEARQLDHPVSNCLALICVGQVYIWNEDWNTAEALIAELIAYANQNALAPYQAVAQGLKGQLQVRRKQARVGVALLSACLYTLPSTHHQLLKGFFMAALAEGLIALGELRDARIVIDQAAVIGADTMHAAEIARIQHMLSLHESIPHSA